MSTAANQKAFNGLRPYRVAPQAKLIIDEDIGFGPLVLHTLRHADVSITRLSRELYNSRLGKVGMLPCSLWNALHRDTITQEWVRNTGLTRWVKDNCPSQFDANSDRYYESLAALEPYKNSSRVRTTLSKGFLPATKRFLLRAGVSQRSFAKKLVSTRTGETGVKPKGYLWPLYDYTSYLPTQTYVVDSGLIPLMREYEGAWLENRNDIMHGLLRLPVIRNVYDCTHPTVIQYATEEKTQWRCSSAKTSLEVCAQIPINVNTLDNRLVRENWGAIDAYASSDPADIIRSGVRQPRLSVFDAVLDEITERLNPDDPCVDTILTVQQQRPSFSIGL